MVSNWNYRVISMIVQVSSKLENRDLLKFFNDITPSIALFPLKLLYLQQNRLLKFLNIYVEIPYLFIL
jgi:hypothetical protein